MGNRSKDSSRLRKELDAIPLLPENLETRKWYWEQIAAARKREFHMAKETNKKSRDLKKEKKERDKTTAKENPGVAYLRRKQQEEQGE